MQHRKTIAVLVGGITDSFSVCLCRGILERAQAQDVNIVVFPCKYIQRDYTALSQINFEYQFETALSHITKKNIDGIISATDSICCFTDPEYREQFMQGFAGIPCVLAASIMEKYPCVTYDNVTGTREGINCMIHDLGLTRIGMISGPDSNPDARIRRQIFLDILRENGLPFEERRIITGNMSRYDKETFSAFLDRNPDIQAVFCHNDETAFGLYEEMKKRGLTPGKDISIMGYDNSDWSAQIFPTLSTVQADPAQIGRICLDLLLQHIDGQPISDCQLASEFILRDSFITPSALRSDGHTNRDTCRQMDHILNEQIQKQDQYYLDIKQYVRNLMLFERGTDSDYGNLFHNIEWLQISSAFLFLYEQPIIHLQGEPFAPPASLLLKTIHDKKSVSIVPKPQQTIPLDALFSNQTLLQQERFSFVFLPLYSNEFIYGFLLCDLTDPIFDNGEFISGLMSAAVKMIDLLKTNNQIQTQLEESLTVLKENNLALETLSQSDPLTGIYNRRGFFDKVEKLLSEPILLLYVDMDNLKIINDRYGHEAGDFSLRSIAHILSDCVGTDGITGRLGGDEFVCAIPTEQEDDLVIQNIYQAFQDFNAGTDKPYNVTVSAGAYRYRPEDTISLSDALILADNHLYETKKDRIKEVIKPQA